jgi:hypothetical protein
VIVVTPHRSIYSQKTICVSNSAAVFLHMRKCVLVAALWILYCCPALAQVDGPPSPGKVAAKVICAANPQQSYALYLPSTYSPTKRWPIVYVFDPGARGTAAVEVIRAAAEQSGYIVAASNNSRNGAEAVSSQAANSMWQDTAQRFSIDEHRRYFAGMSGGARMATALAISCNGCVAGVVANAAGFPQGRKPSNALKFAYFAAVGNADFNFLEFVDLRRDLDASGMPHRIRIFQGRHGWAPPEVWEQALRWMDLQATRSGFLNHDHEWIQESFGEAMQRGKQLLEQQDFLEAFREFSFAVRDFSGLTDVSFAQKQLQALSGDKRFKNAQKQELSAAEEQRRVTGEPAEEIQDLADGKLPPEQLMALRGVFTNLLKRTQASQHSDNRQALIARRALSGLVVQALETGQFAVDRKQYDAALHLFDLAASGSENPAWTHYCRARVYAITADKKHMLTELREASVGGFHDPSVLDSQEFQPFHSDPEFQAVLQTWAKQDPASK